MKKLWKRNAVVAAALVLVCCAIYLNGRYAEKAQPDERTLGQVTLVDAQSTPDDAAQADASGDYFAAARLSRQQARDSALSLLREAQSMESEQNADETARSIQTLASFTLAEAQIENMVTAKGYADCVVFLADEGASVVVSALTDGLQTEDIAKITDIVIRETGLSADCIRIIEAE